MKYKIFNYLALFFSLSVVPTSCVNDEDLVQVDPNLNTYGILSGKQIKMHIQGVNAAYSSLIN